MRSTRTWCSIGATVLLAGAIACSSQDAPVTPSSNSPSGSSGGGTSSATGTLTMRLTDSPFSDAKALLVTFSEVSVHSADPGDWKTVPFTSGTSRTCDLKQLQNGGTDLLGVGQLPAGKYTQIRLNVTSAKIYFDSAAVGGPCAPTITVPASDPGVDVVIPSGEVKLINEFTLASAGGTTITLDFDGDQSVRQTGSGNGNGNGGANGNSKYMMTPVVRVKSIQ